MKKIASLFVLLCAVALFATGCSDANEKFIQGSWYYLDAHLESVSGEQRLEVVWSFANGVFEYEACCFGIDNRVSGRYDIVESQGNTITLRLFMIRGIDFPDPAEIQIKIDRDDDTLSIQGSGPYTPILPGQR